MAVDEALFLKITENAGPPVLRFYSWKPPTVSVGYHQKVGERFDLARCKKRGVDIVRRPTGGREVLHLGELTYSFVISRVSLSEIKGGFRSSMELLGRVFERSLELLGVPPGKVSLGRTRRERTNAPSHRLQPCFLSLSQYEVSVGGKKLIGSAQKSLPTGFLQHGSILLTSEGSQVIELLKEGAQAEAALKKAFWKKTTSLARVLNRRIETQEVITALKEAFSESLDFTLVPSGLKPEELVLGAELQTEKYESCAWYYPANENRQSTIKRSRS